MTENTTHTKEDLKMMQSLPLSIKVRMTEERIRQWYQYWGGKVCVSFSGGKDSTVLMDIARGLYPDIPAVFSNTGLEYPEIQRFVKEYGNVDIVTPSMKFVDVVTQYGYPLIGKEVAEAIYYARRIRSQTGNVEREREREDGRAQASRTMREAERRRWDLMEAERSNAGSTSQDNANFRAGGGEQSTAESDFSEDGTIQKKQNRGKWRNYHRRCLNVGDSPEDKDAFFNKPRDTDWRDWRRGCL